jgi:ribosome-binding ATPase YchF (GTP1/OBG family)
LLVGGRYGAAIVATPSADRLPSQSLPSRSRQLVIGLSSPRPVRGVRFDPLAREGPMKAGLVGAPQSGKTTLFNALTALHRVSDAHVHLGAIKVPDPRVEALAAQLLVRQVKHAEFVFVDLPGWRAGDPGSEALKTIADADALCLVLRGFASLDGSPADPLRELRDFDGQLVLADLSVVDRRLDRLRKAHGGRTGSEFLELETLKKHLDAGRPLRTLSLSEAERKALAHVELLSLKPMLIVVNVGEAEAGKPVPAEIAAAQGAHGAEAIALSAAIEAEIADLDPLDQPTFLDSLGLSEPARDRFIHVAYHLLDLITFFTVGEDEVRAWTLKRGDKAPRAAARIDPELERSLSRVEVTHYDELVSAREKARSHLEGREYIVRDGDLLRMRSDH